jgi:hypothetical protein
MGAARKDGFHPRSLKSNQQAIKFTVRYIMAATAKRVPPVSRKSGAARLVSCGGV